MTTPAGFYPDPDPSTPGQLRYWDGGQWTTTTQMAPLPTKPPRRLIRTGEPVWYIAAMVIYCALILVCAGLSAGASYRGMHDVAATCLKTDTASWSLTSITTDLYSYSGTITNTCRYNLTSVSVTAVGYNADKVADAPNTQYVNFVDAGGSFKVVCHLDGQVATAEITRMEATRN